MKNESLCSGTESIFLCAKNICGIENERQAFYQLSNGLRVNQFLYFEVTYFLGSFQTKAIIQTIQRYCFNTNID